MYDLQIFSVILWAVFLLCRYFYFFKIFMKSSLSVFIFMACSFGVIAKKRCQILGYVVLSLGGSHIKM